MLRPFSIFLALSALTCAPGQHVSAPLPLGGHHVLFVGNSLTYTNDLPATVAAIAASAGDTVRVAMEAGPNLALIDHINGATNALRRIAAEHWDFVILQQGPTPPGICRDSLVLWTTMFDPYIKNAGARTGVFMAWPYAGPIAWFDDIEASFELAAGAVNGTLIPVAEAWRIALGADPSIALYSNDGFHPSSIGTFLSALAVYERVTGKDARRLPARAFSSGVPFNLPEATIRTLQSAAHAAGLRYPVGRTTSTTRSPRVSKTATASPC